MDHERLPASLNDDVHEAAFDRFERRCVVYGIVSAALIVVWAFADGVTDHSYSQGDFRIGWGFWPMWFILLSGIDLGRRARALSRDDR